MAYKYTKTSGNPLLGCGCLLGIVFIAALAIGSGLGVAYWIFR